MGVACSWTTSPAPPADITSITVILPELNQFLIVIVKIESNMCNGNPVLVLLRCQFNAIVRPWQNLAQHSQRGPMVVVHHDPAHTPTPGALGHHHLLRKGDRQRSHSLNGKAARKAAFGVVS